MAWQWLIVPWATPLLQPQFNEYTHPFQVFPQYPQHQHVQQDPNHTHPAYDAHYQVARHYPPPVEGAAVLPGGLKPGTTYMYPEEHCNIIVYRGDVKLNGECCFPTRSEHMCASTTTFNQFIEGVVRGDGWTMTELYDRGGGHYELGMEIKQGSKDGNKSVAEKGFKRNDALVWIHR